MVIPGSKLAKDLLTADGRIIFTKGTLLDEGKLEQLKELEIYSIYVIDERFPDLEAKDIVSEGNRQSAVKAIKTAIDSFSWGRGMELRQTVEKVGLLVEEVTNQSDVLINLSDIRSYDDYTFAHCVNTCILALLLGSSLGYSKERLEELALAAILHDIGMTLLPKDILAKRGNYEPFEYQEVQKHPFWGYEILQRNQISSLATEVVYQHHERYDGKGYPRGLAGRNIMEEARVITIADVYDALTSNRPYRKRLLPHQAYDYMMDSCLSYFDREILVCFFEHIALFPTGTIVLLNTGEKAVVVDQNARQPLSPIVRILISDKGNGWEEYDLLFKRNIQIVAVLEG